ncbi:MAG TPA: CDP-diacylglycerol--glycerol-3-phosphate 3-phosphatidyltransferase [Moraxellaceae bacterium]|nr:CDP-diacylglycerol--glycerol-3-phosphate 3-phosphatidyltransferase [Moraxellaceae bacterium]
MSAATLLNIPNILTLLRIVLIPVLVALSYLSFDWRFWAAAAVFMVAAITDWFDGYLARTLNQTSAFGRFLDPVADKLMVAAALVILVQWHSENPFMVISAIIIISREITISALREWMAEIGKRASVAVSYIGKLKTGMQMTAITVLLVHEPFFDLLGFPLLLVAAMLTLWSMLIYLKAAWPDLRDS